MAKKKPEFRTIKSIKISSKDPTSPNDSVLLGGNQKNKIVFDSAVKSSWEYVVETYKNPKYPVSPSDIANYLISLVFCLISLT